MNCAHQSALVDGEIRCRLCGAHYKLLIGWSGWLSHEQEMRRRRVLARECRARATRQLYLDREIVRTEEKLDLLRELRREAEPPPFGPGRYA